jgi:pimeloyl-ACP methyl ester carboxylesterase
MRRLALLVAATVALALPAGATAAPPDPFGHPCTPQHGVLFCPAADLGQRVATWDGTPIDVDVTLPAQGDGPFPTIVMVHGLGGSKSDFEANDAEGTPRIERYHYNNVFYARRGYAVVTLSQRGYGDSCGRAGSRTPGACDHGWQHLDDLAYEARDIQTLVGMLVDQRVTRPDAIGVTGISYGGGVTGELAFLRDRVKLPEGNLVPWTSPAGTPLHVAAAWQRWGWSDLAYALGPNGRFLETKAWTDTQSIEPGGVAKISFISGLYLLASTAGYVAPKGADPNADLTSAKEATDAGEPFSPGLRDFLHLTTLQKSPAGLFGSTPAPLLVENGWTDDLFPAPEALRTYRMTDNGRNGPVALQLGDLGHGRGANKANQEQFLNDQGAAFFDAYLKQTGTPPAPGSVTVFTQTCPKSAPAGGPIQAPDWRRARRGSLFITDRRRHTILSSSFNKGGSSIGDQILAGDACKTAEAVRVRGAASWSVKVRRGFTMLGLPLIKAKVATRGEFGQLNAHVYDVHRGKITLVARGGYRLNPDQKGSIVFQLNGNAYRFKRGHELQLEITGRDPGYARPSNGSFRVTLSGLTASIPTRERKPR